MITLFYNKNVDIKECMKFTMLSELSLQQRCSSSYLSVSAFNQHVDNHEHMMHEVQDVS